MSQSVSQQDQAAAATNQQNYMYAPSMQQHPHMFPHPPVQMFPHPPVHMFQPTNQQNYMYAPPMQQHPHMFPHPPAYIFQPNPFPHYMLPPITQYPSNYTFQPSTNQHTLTNMTQPTHNLNSMTPPMSQHPFQPSTNQHTLTNMTQPTHNLNSMTPPMSQHLSAYPHLSMDVQLKNIQQRRRAEVERDIQRKKQAAEAARADSPPASKQHPSRHNPLQPQPHVHLHQPHPYPHPPSTHPTTSKCLKTFKTQRGATGLVLSDFKFTLKTKHAEKLTWRCQLRSCNANFDTDHFFIFKSTKPVIHNHICEPPASPAPSAVCETPASPAPSAVCDPPASPAPSAVCEPPASPAPSSAATYISAKGNSCLLVNGVKFHKYFVSKNIIHWRCQSRQKGCKSRCTTTLDFVLITCPNPHEHSTYIRPTSTNIRTPKSLSPTSTEPEPPTSSTPISTAPRPPISFSPSTYIETYTTRIGTTAIRVNGYPFRIKRYNDFYITWKCQAKFCHVGCKTSHDYSLLEEPKEHNHEPVSFSNIYIDKVRLQLKRKAKKNHYTGKPTKLICREIRGNEDKVFFCDFDNFRKTISREKIGKRGKLEADRQEVIDTLKREVELDTREGVELVMEASRDIVMFATRDTLTRLCNKNCPVLSDGTFKYCPKYFYQLYSFHVKKNGFSVPCAHFLLKDKKKATYVKMLKLLKHKCISFGLELDLEAISIDFEVAMIKALKFVFPEINIRLCRFHLGQSWWRKIQKLGLSPLYKSKGQSGKWLRRCFGLPSIDIDIVTESFNQFKKEAPGVLIHFVKYLEKTYLCDNSLFPPKMWAGQLSTEFPSTNNISESFHSHFGSFFESPHPDIILFLDNLSLYHVLGNVKDHSVRAEEETYIENQVFMHSLLRQQTMTCDYFLSQICAEMQPAHI